MNHLTETRRPQAPSTTLLALAASAALLAATPAQADTGKLLLTGGVSQVEGSAGGGLTPWAVIGGYGTRDQIGANAFYTNVGVDDYTLDSYGVLVGFYFGDWMLGGVIGSAMIIIHQQWALARSPGRPHTPTLSPPSPTAPLIAPGCCCPIEDLASEPPRLSV